MATQERRYWEHIFSKDIYMTIKETDKVINLRTGQLSLMDINSLGNVQMLDEKTARIIESYFAQPQPSRTPEPKPLSAHLQVELDDARVCR